MLFEGFREERIDTGEVTLNVRTRGSGPPLLLLHGYPQTGAMWSKIAGELAERFTLVIPDLRGYGKSDKPETDATHAPYSKRATGNDMIRLMEGLGYRSFQAAGHDRGGRVLHRMCLDHPERIERAAVLDIAPTYRIFSTADKKLATAYYHWFFLIQPAPFPETLIGHDPLYFLHHTLGAWGSGLASFDPKALAEYEQCFSDPATIHASCEDYRAAATIDLEHDEADMDARIECPFLVLWGSNGVMEKLYDVLETWRERAHHAEGHAIESGHFLVEENPEETKKALIAFFES